MLDALETYDITWSELNDALRRAESDHGLSAAIAALEQNQRQTGFIKDDMRDVQRYVFTDPNNPGRFFRVQFNARRMHRFGGAGLTAPPAGIEAVHGGCYLCRDNVRWQQQGAELGYAIEVCGNDYLAWMNPFPLTPGHVVVASQAHETQDWIFREEHGQSFERLVGDLIELARRMPGYIGIYNGRDAGASIPGHLHFQFFRRPEGHPVFPMEARMGDRHPDGDRPVLSTDYPVPVVEWDGPAATVARMATAWLEDWAKRNAGRLYRLTSNMIATAEEDGRVSLYFVPRDQTLTRGEGMSGLVGGLEVLGEVVMSSPEEKARLDSGEIDYATVENMLVSVRTPLFAEEA